MFYQICKGFNLSYGNEFYTKIWFTDKDGYSMSVPYDDKVKYNNRTGKFTLRYQKNRTTILNNTKV